MRIYSAIFIFVLCVSRISTDSSSTFSAAVTTISRIQTTVLTTESSKETSETVPETTRATSTETQPATSETVPETTSTSVPITTVAPTKTPEPTEGSWNVTEDDLVCIRVKMAVQINVHAKDLKIVHDLSPNASVDYPSSGCFSSDNKTQTMVLEDGDYRLGFIFAKDGSQVYVRNITVQWSADKADENTVNGKYFSAATDKSYQCSSQDPIKMENVTVSFYSLLHVQAFLDEGNKDFSLAEFCANDDKMNDIVPIAVACALVAMVVVILISYLVFRRRTRQTGYESV